MAVTKILARRGGLSQAIAYVLNGDKTEEQILTAAQGCLTSTACHDMAAVKQRWNTVLTEANRQIYAYEHPKQPAYAPSAEVIRLSNAINRGLEQPDSPEAVMALILQGAAARYDCCPEPISEYENFDHLPKADWNHFRRVVSYITITQEHIITVQFTDQAGKDE